MASDSSSGFFSHFRQGVLHITLQIRKAQPIGWKKEQTNEHGLGEGESLRDTFVQLFMPLYTIVGVYFARNFFKATRNANSSLTIFPHRLLLLTVLLLDCYFKSTVLLCPASSTGSLCLLRDLPSLLHFRSCERSRPQFFV